MADRLNPRQAVYPGTFDPVHRGHIDIIQRGSQLYEHLIVGVGINPDKTPFFSLEERIHLLEVVTGDLPNVRVQAFEGLTVRFVDSVGAKVLLRGLRSLSDMEYEFNMSLMNLNLAPHIETVFLMAREEYSHVSSSLLRQIAVLGGTLSRFLPPEVERALLGRARERQP